MPTMKTLTIGGTTWDIEGGVTSVNGQTGAVVLDAEDVGAATEQDIADAIIQVLPVDSASGSVASFPDGYPAPVESLSCAIAPVQDLNGYDNPWPAGGGKNIVDANPYTAVVGEQANITVATLSLKAGKTYTFSCKQSVSVPTSLRNTIALGLANDTAQYENISENFNPTNLRHTLTYTSPADQLCQFRFWIHTPSVSATYSEIQIEESASFTGYAPYSNICPISGHTEANVIRSGENVWDEETESGFISDQGADTASANHVRSVNYTPCKPSTSYCCVKPAGIWFSMNWYDINKTFISQSAFQSDATKVIASPSNAYYFRVCVRESTYQNDASVNYPSTDTTYHAHEPTQTVTVDLSGTRYGGSLDVKSGVLTVTHKYCTPAKADWRRNAEKQFYSLADADLATGTDVPCISDKFRAWDGVESRYNTPNISFCNSTGAIRVNTAIEYATVDDFWSAVGESSFVCQLKAPLSVQLTLAELETLLGQNNVWANCGDVTVSYRADIQKYIDKKLS